MIFSKRLALEKKFKEWAGKHAIPNSPLNVITFLDQEGFLPDTDVRNDKCLLKETHADSDKNHCPNCNNPCICVVMT